MEKTHQEFIDETKREAQKNLKWWQNRLSEWEECAENARQEIEKAQAWIENVETWEVPNDCNSAE